MGKRRKSREIAVQVLYQVEMMEQTPEEGMDIFLENFSVKENVKEYAGALVFGVHGHLDAIDPLIEKFSRHWKIDRMTAIDRNILRLAAYEILFNESVPDNVCINEALEVAKKFSADDSSSFINGILDAIAKSKGDRSKGNDES